MLERLLLAVALVSFGYVVFRLYSARQLHTLRRYKADELLLQPFRLGVPTIVYFTTPTCAPCRLQQQPALLRLQAALGADNIQIIHVDITQAPDIASRWGVLSAPTTFLLNRAGVPVVVNHGVADEVKLKHQIETSA